MPRYEQNEFYVDLCARCAALPVGDLAKMLGLLPEDVAIMRSHGDWPPEMDDECAEIYAEEPMNCEACEEILTQEDARCLVRNTERQPQCKKP